ncbi:iron-containing redox enzyme family protein [Salinibacterium sp. dk5596]|uniref:iron-containing redox enzyme family protein n=1 Tax=unclassified Salinibacterium TaxID=2632331 RepID=UPI003519F518
MNSLAASTASPATTTTQARYAPPRFSARGPISSTILNALACGIRAAGDSLGDLEHSTRVAIAASPDIVRDDDLQLALLILHGLHYGGVVESDDDWEWHPALVAARVAIERAFEAELRRQVPVPELPNPSAEDVAAALFELTKPTAGPSFSRYVARKASEEHLREYLVLRSVYTLKEADAQTWAVPRLPARAKAALMEIQTDEYGAGDPERMHSAIFARAMRGLGLDDRYGSYIDCVPAVTIASFTMMTMFGLNRSLRGATAGHFSAYEMTSSIPNRYIAQGVRRLGFSDDIAWYFDEHVEADAVHEQIAGRDLSGGLAEAEPSLLADIMWGANCSLLVDGWGSAEALAHWEAGRSALRVPMPSGAER